MLRNRLIVVDDSLSDIELVKISLSDCPAKIQLSTFSDGEELLLHLGQQTLQDVGVILMDLNMPRMSGHEVLAQLKSNRQLAELPVIIFSTSTNENDILRSYELGARDYICKPMDYHTFHDTITQIIQHWLLAGQQATV
jgi:CheY-like chemotaxis protein